MTRSAADSIALRDVSFAHGGTSILGGVTLTVEKGETLVLVGRSGAGKTTILKLINRMLLPAAGDVEVLGRSTREWNPIALRRGIGYVLQGIGLFPHMTVGDNVALVPRLLEWPEAQVASRVEEVLALVGLPAGEFAARRPDQLSGGQQQRVGVARALAADPPILLMDEPFGALDPVTRGELHREMRRIQSALRKTVVLVTHDMSEAFALASRIGVLAGGSLAALAAPGDIARSGDDRVRPLLEPLLEAGAALERARA